MGNSSIKIGKLARVADVQGSDKQFAAAVAHAIRVEADKGHGMISENGIERAINHAKACCRPVGLKHLKW